jgi:hypothetical protein
MKEKRKRKSRDEKQVFMNTLFRATVLHLSSAKYIMLNDRVINE